jgi:hypothetical protein
LNPRPHPLKPPNQHTSEPQAQAAGNEYPADPGTRDGDRHGAHEELGKGKRTCNRLGRAKPVDHSVRKVVSSAAEHRSPSAGARIGNERGVKNHEGYQESGDDHAA